MDASQNEAAQHQSSVSQDLASKSVTQVNDSFVAADKQPVEGTKQFGYNELENDFAKVLNGQLEEEEYFEEDSSDINSLSIESSISKKLLKEESFTQKQKENRDKSVDVEDVDEDELSLKEVEVKIPNFKAIIKETENDENKDISQIQVVTQSSAEEEKEGQFMKKMSLKFGFKLQVDEVKDSKTPDPNLGFENNENFNNVKISKF